MPEESSGAERYRQFLTTHWSMILAAGGPIDQARSEALESLCRAYWYPLYAYIRRAGNPPEDAKDLTQGFFSQLLEKGTLSQAERERGRFRTFLLSALKNYLIGQRRREMALKR